MEIDWGVGVKKFLRDLKVWLMIFGIILGVVALFAVDFSIWRAGHPDAPTWVYFLKSE